MIGQAAATAAVLAIDGDQSVRDIHYEKLSEQLLNDGQIPAPGAL